MTNVSLNTEAIQELIERNDAQEMLRTATRLQKWLGDVRELVHELEVAIGELETFESTSKTSEQGDSYGTEENKREKTSKEINKKILSRKATSG